jgi:CBS domain containing-hemolysin-like protein
MIGALQLWLAPVAGALLTLWAAAIGLAAGGDAALARMLAARVPDAGRSPSAARGLHVIHLALLLGGAAMAGAALGWWAHPTTEAVPRFIVAVVLVWLVGDLLPRVLASLSPDLVEAGSAVAAASLRLFRPLLRLVAWADRQGRGGHAAPEGPSPPGTDREMLGGIFALRDMTVAEVMTPRIDIVGVDLANSRSDVVDRFRQSEHSRLLVFDRSPDAVIGVLYAKDLLPGLGETGEWHGLIRPAAFVPEAKSLANQLLDFQRGPSHIGVVVDEFGGTAGLITLEDALEQIVGEIRDEYDTDEALPIQSQGTGRWLVQGGVALAELEGHLDHGFDREDVDTVGGLLLAVLGHVPRVGEAVDLGPYRFTVDQVARRRVRRVVVELVTPVEAESAP